MVRNDTVYKVQKRQNKESLWPHLNFEAATFLAITSFLANSKRFFPFLGAFAVLEEENFFFATPEEVFGTTTCVCFETIFFPSFPETTFCTVLIAVDLPGGGASMNALRLRLSVSFL
eukprot:TRINITY_DN659_c0_g1_i6.p1 TRINITY_DN659_c0_g1~~TRINITY_DN659_c0_g1_i6.p1  ORF type:complete len:117 (-),score=10.63 TRINITY_DN659_c0_g1_i6:529-879(-)